MILGLGFWVWDFGFRVQDLELECRICAWSLQRQ